MKKLFLIALLFCSLTAISQTDTSGRVGGHSFVTYDTVTITALGRLAGNKIPFNIQSVNLRKLQLTPHPQLMQQLALLPSVSSISSGSNINKPVIRGLSFNHVQLFAMGTRIDNQTWDDRHDIGLAETGFDNVEVISGPAALLYGPNAMGGAILFHETVPGVNEKLNGYGQLSFFGNSLGGNVKAGVREGKEHLYYSLNAEYDMHANYVQGKKDEENGAAEEDKPLAGNSKFTDLAFKGMIGTRNENSQHQFNYSLYQQQLGIIEDESGNGTSQPEEERDYEMEAPYQDVTTHILSTENTWKTKQGDLVVNAAYQYNHRLEYEPGDQPKSKELGVGLNLSTITADIQWQHGKTSSSGYTFGIQASYQNNKNIGNAILVPDAHISTVGAFALGHLTIGKLNLLAGARVDVHQLKMFKTDSNEPDTLVPPIPEPEQELTKNFTPFSFSAGAVYHLTDQFSVKLNVATGYTAPNYAQLTAFGKHEGTYRFEVGNNNLDKEQNTEADLTFLYENENISASLNGYTNNIHNYIYITPTADSVGGLKIYDWTQHNATINGIELGFNLHPVTAKWFEGSIHAGLLSGKLSNGGGYLPYIPATKVITDLTFKSESARWKNMYATLRVSAYGSQNNVAEFEEPTDGYVLTDLYIGATPSLGKNNRWGVTVFCTNLFNVGYFSHLSLIKAIDVFEPGRNIGAQLRYSF